ncbi:hypothetical protein AVEN_174448-1 [Araneus ventricosus]|uniref:Uncharacterized protein n=1 Tax=Araneus ventricosus TaxID=182803 RepID=A0A4Y2FQW2_ARAVE|nr:hypothetical protein AVEN_174448-1 [Araneus ventricosus]
MYWNYTVPGIRIGLIYLTGLALDTQIYFAFYCGPPNLDKLPAQHFQLFEVMLHNTGYNSAPGTSMRSLALDIFNVSQVRKVHKGSSVESGLTPVTIRFRSQEAKKPLRQYIFYRKYLYQMAKKIL